MREGLFIKKNIDKWKQYQYHPATDPDEMASQFTDHHRVDQIDRWVIEGDSPERRCRAVHSETRVCHEGSALRGENAHALFLSSMK